MDAPEIVEAVALASLAAWEIVDRLSAWDRYSEAHRLEEPTVPNQSCSWCHASNVWGAGQPRPLCYACHHRADLPRIRCDCKACVTPYRPEAPTEADAGAAIAELDRRPS